MEYEMDHCPAPWNCQPTCYEACLGCLQKADKQPSCKEGCTTSFFMMLKNKNQEVNQNGTTREKIQSGSLYCQCLCQ